MPTIRLDNFNLGGLADSKYQGLKYSLASIVGFDLHSEPGVLKVNQKLVKESGTTVDELVKTILPCSDGNTYLFSSTSGKVWKRTSGGSYSLVTTLTPASGSAGVTDACEKDGYILYAMQNFLGQVLVGAPTDWSTRNDGWAAFTNQNAYHPIKKLNLLAYIGDGNLVAQVNETNVFTADALDLEDQYNVKTLSAWIRKLMIGCYISDNVPSSPIFQWNTWSESFQNPDDVPEVGIQAWQEIDNGLLAHAGYKGNIYQYDGVQLIHLKRVLGDWTGSNQAKVNPNAVASFGRLPLFGLSNIAGNPAKQGVYCFGSAGNNYPRVLDLSYLISQGVSGNVEIGAVMPISADKFLVAWKDNNTTPSATYGVDVLDTSNKFSGAYIESRILGIQRAIQKKFSIDVFYRSLPTGTDINILADVNNTGSYTAVASRKDAGRLRKYAEVGVGNAAEAQFKITTTASGNNAPEIEAVEISF